jgi:4-hydroxy 2-oxovalerate aldolase
MINFYDVTLRDGNHAARHTLGRDFVIEYCKIADTSGVWAVEVGHGNGIGASSFLVGKALTPDNELLDAARSSLTSTRLAVHLIPGFATIKKNIRPAIEIGVDVFRVGTHVTEVDTAKKHVEYLAENRKDCQGVMMMSHTVDAKTQATQAAELVRYGANAVVVMDSAGHFVPKDVRQRVRALKDSLCVPVGFHAHNNLGMGVANALAAVEEGAEIVDGSSMGLGAGAGNASLEAVVVNCKRTFEAQIDLEPFFEMSHLVEIRCKDFLPRATSTSIQSGNAGVFSGFAPQVRELSKEFGISQEELWQEIGKRRLVAGQESMIREIAQDLMNL